MSRLLSVKVPLWVVALPVVAGVAFAAGSAAAQPSAINACVTNSTGALRVPQTGANGAVGSCLPNETPLQWNVQGVQGPAGPAGPAGASGPVAGYQVVTNTNTSNALIVGAQARCPSGKHALGGGGESGLFGPTGADKPLISSAPTVDNAGWNAVVQNLNAEQITVIAYAMCATTQS